MDSSQISHLDLVTCGKDASAQMAEIQPILSWGQQGSLNYEILFELIQQESAA